MDKIDKRLERYNVAIVGGGVIGTSLFYVLGKYTNVKSVVLIEKYRELAQVNSHHHNNSQTLHFGDIETNYTLEKAGEVSEAAEMVAAYIEKYAQGAFRKRHKMVLAVGEREVEELEQRYEAFRELFPRLRKITKDEIAKVEPNVMRGRDPQEKLLALLSEDGYIVNYKKLAESFVVQALLQKEKNLRVLMDTKVQSIKKDGVGHRLITERGVMLADTVVVAASSHSLLFAKSLGYGKEFGILPVAGNFYCAKDVLNGKVYMMQIKKLPFAAVHGDPDVTNPHETRFGPTIRVLPLLERHNYKTIADFLKTSAWSVDGVLSLLSITFDKTILSYVMKQIIYDLPLVGKWLFLRQEVRKIVPSLKLKELTHGHGIGGIRPQVVNIKARKMEMGEAEIIGDKIIFNITPSPGASMCLKSAEKAAEKLMRFLGREFGFDKDALRKDLSRSVMRQS